MTDWDAEFAGGEGFLEDWEGFLGKKVFRKGFFFISTKKNLGGGTFL